jgi:hypothetical protein
VTIPEPAGQPDVERPVEITDTPGDHDHVGPAPTPEHHPDTDLQDNDVPMPTPGTATP